MEGAPPDGMGGEPSHGGGAAGRWLRYRTMGRTSAVIPRPGVVGERWKRSTRAPVTQTTNTVAC